MILPEEVLKTIGRDYIIQKPEQGKVAQYQKRMGRSRRLGTRKSGDTNLRTKKKLLSAIPRHTETVLIHGDVASDNFLHQNNQICSIIDWSEAGYGDRHADLALAYREIRRLNNSDRLWHIFLNSYGTNCYSSEHISFYLLLDEFM